MASTTNAIVTVKEYLQGVCHPDMDYVDGTLEDRNAGAYDHGSLQAALMRYLSAHRLELNLRIVQEQRMQITATRYRVPDTWCFPVICNRNRFSLGRRWCASPVSRRPVRAHAA